MLQPALCAMSIPSLGKVYSAPLALHGSGAIYPKFSGPSAVPSTLPTSETVGPNNQVITSFTGRQTQEAIKMNIELRPFLFNPKVSTHAQQGHILFGFRKSQDNTRSFLTGMNLSDLNIFLRAQYVRSKDIEDKLHKKVNSGQTKKRKVFDIVTENEDDYKPYDVDGTLAEKKKDLENIPQAELQKRQLELFKFSESTWYPDIYFQTAFEGGSNTQNVLRYMAARSILDDWNYLGTVSTSMEYFSHKQYVPGKSISVTVGGVDNMINYWGSETEDLRAGDSLYLILKRTWNPMTLIYEHFAFHPWVGYYDECPGYKDLTYIGRSEDEELEKGIPIYIGQVIDPTFNQNNLRSTSSMSSGVHHFDDEEVFNAAQNSPMITVMYKL